MTAQVLIVGAGPVGMTMAAELARYGVSVRIVDKAAHRTDKSKALVLWSRTLELLDRAGCGGSFIDAGHRVTAANIVAHNKVVGHVDVSIVDSPHPFALMLPQADTERILEEHLVRLGVHVEREVELMSFTKRDDGVSAVLKPLNGSEEKCDAEWLVGCDGAHSTIRHGLGLQFMGDTLQSNWILADAHLTGYPFPDSEIATYWHEDGVIVFFPITPGRYRIIANVELAAGVVPTDPTLQEVQRVMDQRGPGNVTVSDPIWLAAFRINERKVADYRSGRVFLAGDAAHVHSPAGGQGMNTGMQDAFNLAWKLALVMKGDCAPTLLDSYSAERSEVGEQVLAAAGRLTAMAVMKNHAAQTVRNLAAHVLFGFAPVREAMANTLTELSIHYHDSPLNGPKVSGVPKPRPGDRVRPPIGEMPFGSGDWPRFAVCADANATTGQLLSQFGNVVEATLRPPLEQGGMWLVRPDGYVACVAKDGDTHAIADYLQRICV